jgi:hypothetical protein
MSSRGIFLPVLALLAGVHCGGSDETGGGSGVLCGNGVVDPLETCDGASCPASCDDGDACTTDALSGDAASCTAVCAHEPIEACTPPTCGDGVVDRGEVCDDGPANGGSWSATEHCNASCSGSAPYCGDGTVDTTHETCGERGLSACAAGDACIACACVPCSPQGDPTLAARLVLSDIVDVAPAPQRLYLAADGTGLHVLDLADPTAPTLLGMVAMPAARAVAVDGTYAYVVDTTSGLAIVDAADATNAAIVGSYAIADANDVAVAGSYAYLASSTFDVLDVGDPMNPMLVGSLDMFAGTLAVEGSHAYVTNFSGLHVIDVSNPSSPVVVGTTPLSGFVGALAVAGGLAYVAIDDEIRVHDVSDPTSPTWVGTYVAPNTVYDLAATGSYVYAAYGDFPHGVAVVNATNPAAPAAAGTIQAWAPHAVGTGGGLTFVAGSVSGYPELPVLDVYDTPVPGAGTLLGSYDGPTDVAAITVAGGYAYVADWRKLQTFDVTDPETPRRRKSQQLPGYATGVHFADGRIYYTSNSTQSCSFAGYLHVFDAVDPANPVLLGMLSESQACMQDVTGAFGYAYAGYQSLGVVSLADPSMPVLEASFDYGFVGETTIVGSLAYVASDTGLSVLDLTTPTAPVLVGSFTTPNGALGVAVAGDRAYLAVGVDGIDVLDVSSPASPMLLGAFDTPGGALKVAMANDAAIVADSEAVVVVDVADPASPTLVGSYAATGTVWDVEYADGYAYVAAGTDGALVLRVCQ